MSRYLGIDWGEKRIGLATADTDLNFALPFKTVANYTELMAVINEEEIDIIVLGEPKKMRGELADNKHWLKFYEQLQQDSNCPVYLIDERLSSLGADALLGEKKDKAGRDEIAASIILQTYLDQQ